MTGDLGFFASLLLVPEAYMMGDLYKKNTCLDFPKGGNEALVGALVRGIEKHPGGHSGFHREFAMFSAIAGSILDHVSHG